jgi:hypothetical protein
MLGRSAMGATMSGGLRLEGAARLAVVGDVEHAPASAPSPARQPRGLGYKSNRLIGRGQLCLRARQVPARRGVR